MTGMSATSTKFVPFRHQRCFTTRDEAFLKGCHSKNWFVHQVYLKYFCLLAGKVELDKFDGTL